MHLVFVEACPIDSNSSSTSFAHTGRPPDASNVTADGLPSWFASSQEPSSPRRTTSEITLEDELKNGKFGVVRSLLRVLEGGSASKAVVDTVIDACKYAFHRLACLLGQHLQRLQAGFLVMPSRLACQRITRDSGGLQFMRDPL